MKNPKPLHNATPAFGVVLVGLLATAISFGQIRTATVPGTATDLRAGVFANTQVSPAEPDTGTVQSTLTGATGKYRFLDVRVGRHPVSPEAPGRVALLIHKP
jgi:hypothetical protein